MSANTEIAHRAGKRRRGMSRQTLAIVGGGASGTLTAAHLLRLAHGTWRVVLIDRSSHGPGIAYATRDHQHLLNVPAGLMSAFDDDANHLVRWCRERGRATGEHEYLPRQLYGAYLRNLLVEPADGGDVELVQDEVVGLNDAVSHGHIVVALRSGRCIPADAVVVAIGNPLPARLAAVRAGRRVINDPWNPESLDRIRGAGHVVVVGTGLTAVDIAQTATIGGTTVFAISRHGELPRVHKAAGRPTPTPPLVLGTDVVDLASVLQAIGGALLANPSEWRGVVDSLRPLTPNLWQALSLDDRRTFLREFKWLWDLHRHRLAPPVGAQIENLRSLGRLQVASARIVAARSTPSNVAVCIEQDGEQRELTADWLINATGPASNIANVPDPFIGQLLASGLARPDDLGIGFACARNGALLGAGSADHRRLFTLGPPRRGELLESNAIPEIRAQAAHIAETLVAGLETRTPGRGPRHSPASHAGGVRAAG